MEFPWFLVSAPGVQPVQCNYGPSGITICPRERESLYPHLRCRLTRRKETYMRVPHVLCYCFSNVLAGSWHIVHFRLFGCMDVVIWLFSTFVVWSVLYTYIISHIRINKAGILTFVLPFFRPFLVELGSFQKISSNEVRWAEISQHKLKSVQVRNATRNWIFLLSRPLWGGRLPNTHDGFVWSMSPFWFPSKSGQELNFYRRIWASSMKLTLSFLIVMGGNIWGPHPCHSRILALISGRYGTLFPIHINNRNLSTVNKSSRCCVLNPWVHITASLTCPEGM